MKLLIVFLAGILALFSIETEAHAADIAHFTHLAKQLRKSKSHYTRDEKRRLLRQHRDILRQIRHYGDGPIELAVAAFVRNGLKADTYRIINAKETSFGGESKAKVFFIHDKHGVMKYVVKAFPKPRRFDSGFLAELSGMALIKERNLTNVSAVNPVAIGMCRQNGSEYGLLLLTAAPGQRADQFIQAVLDTSINDPLRKERLKTACRICRAIGTGLAEFHGLDDQQRAVLQRTGLLRAKVEFDLLMPPAIKRELKDHIDFEALGSYMRMQIHNALKMDSGKYYRHGDAGPKNVFYDPKTKRIVFIDVARIHHFINRAGLPQARGIDDLYLMHRKIIEQAQNDLSQEELLQLSEGLCSGYTDISGCDTPKFHSGNLYNVLADLSRYCSLPEAERSKQSPLLQKHIEFFKKLLE
ncbi:MAG: aminoglycoside phosphotransferase family protein [Parachlamydia sp.]|nr:aminoglycoside phosphotransferase family protein [Parachlamydia sp.]